MSVRRFRAGYERLRAHPSSGVPAKLSLKNGGGRLPLAAAEEGELLEQMHVLLVLEQGAMQRRDQFLGVALAQCLRRNVLIEQQLEPVEELDVVGFFFSPGVSRSVKNDRMASSTSRGLIDG